MKYLNKKNVCITMYGDGASNQGQLYEACNMAGLWKLPVIYCIENNHFGMGTSVERASHYQPLMARFRGFPGIKLDGLNIFSVREGVKFCKAWVLEHGPIFLEIETYRYAGHSMSDSGVSYRTKDEVIELRSKRDCIAYVRNLIINNNLATDDELKKIDKEIKTRIEEEIENIRNDPYPETDQLYKHVYVNETPPFIRGAEYQNSIFNSGKY
jgi:pyruvate dehydrogenase E1 component alpha subunit